MVRRGVSHTFLLIKNEARHAFPAVIDLLQRDGFRLFDLGTVVLTPELVGQLYAEHWGRPYFEPLVQRMCNLSVEMLYLMKKTPNAVADLRALVGPTDCSAPDTLRMRFGRNLQLNGFHSPDTNVSFLREAALLLPHMGRSEMETIWTIPDRFLAAPIMIGVQPIRQVFDDYHTQMTSTDPKRFPLPFVDEEEMLPLRDSMEEETQSIPNDYEESLEDVD